MTLAAECRVPMMEASDTCGLNLHLYRDTSSWMRLILPEPFCGFLLSDEVLCFSFLESRLVRISYVVWLKSL